MHIKRLFKWASSSLLGHLFLFQLLWAVPMFTLGWYLNYSEGTLTWAWAPHVAFYSALGGVTMALLIWYTISLPLINRQKKGN